MNWTIISSSEFHLDLNGIATAYIKYNGLGWILLIGNTSVARTFDTPEEAQEYLPVALAFKLARFLDVDSVNKILS